MAPREGQVAVNKTNGQTAVFTQGQWVAQKPQGAPADASQRGRMAIGLGPMVSAQESMQRAEQHGNPLQKDWGAALLSGASEIGVGSVKPFSGLDQIAKAWGGQDFQSYQQAAKQFEAQLMPLMSGAAVSPSEAARQIKAALPELGDSPETLEAKSRARQQMLNGAAKMAGAPLPYSGVPTFGVNSNSLPPVQPTRQPPRPGAVENGYQYLGGDPSKPESWQRVR